MSLKLPPELQRVAPFIAVAVLAVVGLLLVTHGMGGSSESSAADATQVLERAFTTSPKSGVIDLRLNASPAVYSLKGPFTQNAADLKVTETGNGKDLSAQIVVADGKGYLSFGGRFYELTPAQMQKVPGGSGQTASLSALGFNVNNWIVDPKIVGKARVDGIQVDHVKGKLNADAMLADVQRLGNVKDVAALRKASKDGDVDVYVGTGDGIVREIDVTSRFQSEAGGKPKTTTMRFDVGVSEVNKPQDIKPPANALPARRLNEIPAARLGSLAAALRDDGSKSGSQTKPKQQTPPPQQQSPSPAPKPASARSRQAYVSCVEQAADTAALEKCQAFAPRR